MYVLRKEELIADKQICVTYSPNKTQPQLYGRILMDENPELDNGLERGRYTLHVKYRYPVLFYQSKKFFVLSTTRLGMFSAVMYHVLLFTLLDLRF